MKKEHIKKGMLWPCVKNVEVYRCPSDRRKNSPHHKYAYRTYSIAGGMNGVLDVYACKVLQWGSSEHATHGECRPHHEGVKRNVATRSVETVVKEDCHV